MQTPDIPTKPISVIPMLDVSVSSLLEMEILEFALALSSGTADPMAFVVASARTVLNRTSIFALRACVTLAVERGPVLRVPFIIVCCVHTTLCSSSRSGIPSTAAIPAA